MRIPIWLVLCFLSFPPLVSGQWRPIEELIVENAHGEVAEADLRAHIGDPKSADRLVIFLMSPGNSYYWEFAIELLGQIGDNRTVDDLIGVLEDFLTAADEDRSRDIAKALLALGKLARRLKSEKAITYLAQGLHWEHWARLIKVPLSEQDWRGWQRWLFFLNVTALEISAHPEALHQLIAFKKRQINLKEIGMDMDVEAAIAVCERNMLAGK